METARKNRHVRLRSSEGGGDIIALWKSVMLEEGREKVGSWWVRWKITRPKGNGSLETRRLGHGQEAAKVGNRVLLPIGGGGGHFWGTLVCQCIRASDPPALVRT